MESRLQRARTVLCLCSVFVLAAHCSFIPQCCNCTSKDEFRNCGGSFIGPRNHHSNQKDYIETAIPKGLDILAFNNGKVKKVAKICENSSDESSGTFASYYDCNLKIPLYTAISLTGDQLRKRITVTRQFRFYQSCKIQDPYCQANNSDYSKVRNVSICYYEKNGNCILDLQWQKSLGQYTEADIDQGHLTAALFSMDTDRNRSFTRKNATYAFTNIFPQFAGFNRGSWREKQKEVVGKWTKHTCGLDNMTDTQIKLFRLYIISGTVPSTYLLSKDNKTNPRFFGHGGFSDYVHNNFSINVPSHAWMAACCRYQIDGDYIVKSIASYGENRPTRGSPSPEMKTTTVIELSKFLSNGFINFFPEERDCN